MQTHPRHRDTASGARRIECTAWVMMAVVTCGLVLVLCRVAVIKVRPADGVRQLLGTHLGTRRMPARRGSLVDRRGRVLAATRVHHRIFVDPQIIKTPGTFAERVAHELGYDPAALERLIGERWDKRYVVIDRDPTDWRVARARAMRLRGLAIEPYTRREYPQGALAGQVIGFVGADGEGLEGLEKVLDRDIRETDGRLRYVRDAGGRALWVDWSEYRPPDDGGAVRLSLDVSIQTIAEQELASTCERFGANSGQIVVMDPHNGQVLAMANYPLFDPNAFGKTPPDLRRNRCVTDVFEPGSTFKPFIWAAATEQGWAEIDETIDCTDSGFYVSPKGRRLRDAHAYGELSWEQVLVKSSNIGMAIVAQRMGTQRIHAAVKAFGFGDRTGSGFPGEVAGIVRPAHKWNHYSETSVPMGQEVAVTALQMAAAFGAFANGGVIVAPSFVDRASDGSGSAGRAMVEPVYRRAIQPQTARIVREVLRKVVQEGTGRKANSKLYAIFGKTGTAQVADPSGKGYLDDQYIASFIAGAPYDRPRIVVACMVHRPDKSKGHYGGTVSAPPVRRVIERTLTYMGVPTQAEVHAQQDSRLAAVQ